MKFILFFRAWDDSARLCCRDEVLLKKREIKHSEEIFFFRQNEGFPGMHIVFEMIALKKILGEN